MSDDIDDNDKNIIRAEPIFEAKYMPGNASRQPVDDGSESYYRYHRWLPPGKDNFIDNINLFYAYNENSKNPIMHFNADGTITFVSKGNFLGEFVAFEYKYTIADPNNPNNTIDKKQNMGIGWFNADRRRNHKLIVFDPSRVYDINDESYNLWNGYNHLKPRKGDWTQFGNFVKNIICGGNEEDYQFQLGAISSKLRKPNIKITFATVLQGDKGIGKTFYAERFGDLFGPKYSKILSQREKFFSRFNTNLATMLFVCLDEAFYVGNRSEGAQIKGYITGKTIDVEYKYGPTVTIPNFAYLMLIGNHKHIVEATEKERRYHCLTPTEDKLQDEKYFGELQKAWDDHERDAFAYYLLYEHKLDNFNMYKVPNTAGLMRQKLLSFDAREVDGKVKKWIYQNILMDAVLPYTDKVTLDNKGNPDKIEDGKEPDGSARVIKDRLYQICLRQCHINASDLSKEEFGRILYAAFPDGSGGSVIKQGRAKSARDENGAKLPRDPTHMFPPLSVARQSFARGMSVGLGGEIQWNDYNEWDKMSVEAF